MYLCNRGTNILGVTEEFVYMHRCQLSACVLATPEVGLALEDDRPFSPNLQMLPPCLGRLNTAAESYTNEELQNLGC